MNFKLDNWPDLKARIDAASLHVRYEETPDEYYLVAGDAITSYSLRLIKDGGADQTDFETNYKTGANSPSRMENTAFGFKNYPTNQASMFRKTFKYPVTGGDDVAFSEKFSSEVSLFGGTYEVIGTPVDGDYVEFSITDEDNLLGYGPGFTVAKYVETEYVNIDRKRDAIESEGAKPVPAGLYFTSRYFSAGSSPANDVKFIVRYVLRRA